MKTTRKYYPWAFIAAFQLVVNVSVAQSKWTNPEDWETLVSNKRENPTEAVKDTIFLQGFDEEEYNIWDYTVTGKHDFFYPKEEGIRGASDSRAIRLYPGSTLSFNFESLPYDKTASKRSEINIPFAVQHVNTGEHLYYFGNWAYRNEQIETDVLKIGKDDVSYYFRQTSKCLAHFQYTEPDSLALIVYEGTNPSDTGYYCVDSVLWKFYAPLYTLLTSSGNWFDWNNWTHLYPTPHRIGLIQGEVTIDRPAICQSLMTYHADIQFTSQGALRTSGMTSLYTFPEKGKWYFLSFPFDVYLEGVDEDFEWGDASTDTSSKAANIFYVREYDGVSRSAGGESEANWRVLSPDSFDASQPLFRKGKGYLVAIDETSDTSTLAFTSSGETLEFTTEMRIPIEADEAQMGDEADNGWFLCGNPYPSSLSLSEIQPNPYLDGHIYVYDGSRYEAYAIGSEHSLPPHAAFFVKATGNTELTIYKEKTDTRSLITSSALSSLALQRGPVTGIESPAPSLLYRIEGNELVLPSLDSPGWVVIYNLQGKLLRKLSVSSGSVRVALPLLHEMLLIQVRTGTQTFVLKHRTN